MAYTYLITGATSDVGAALIRHLLTEAPGEDRTILAQGCGDLARLDALVQQFPGRIVTFDADLSSPEAVDALCARFGITVNCVAPSMMETHFLKDTPDLIVQAAAADNPMGRNATPEDVAPAMAFLLSEEARFITGVTLPVTGGSAIV